MDNLEQILQEIRGEREYQDSKWGIEFDDKNTLNDWITYMTIYLGRAAKMGNPEAEKRLALLKVAAIAVAAVEAFDRNQGFPPRHYD